MSTKNIHVPIVAPEGATHWDKDTFQFYRAKGSHVLRQGYLHSWIRSEVALQDIKKRGVVL